MAHADRVAAAEGRRSGAGTSHARCRAWRRGRALRRQEPRPLGGRGEVACGRWRRHGRQGGHPDQTGIRRLPAARRVSAAFTRRGQGTGTRQLGRVPDGPVRDPGARLIRRRHRRPPHLSRWPMRRTLQAATAGGECLPQAWRMADLRHPVHAAAVQCRRLACEARSGERAP